jgi:extracellular matrix regulatory protein A
MELLNVGFGNFVVIERLLGILNPESAPMKRLREEARIKDRLVDATQGRRTRSIILMDSGHMVLSGVQTDTLAQRLTPRSEKSAKSDD